MRGLGLGPGGKRRVCSRDGFIDVVLRNGRTVPDYFVVERAYGLEGLVCYDILAVDDERNGLAGRELS